MGSAGLRSYSNPDLCTQAYGCIRVKGGGWNPNEGNEGGMILTKALQQLTLKGYLKGSG